VGFGKPPKQHQWKKGVSGNPRGRTKGSKNIKTIYAARFNDRVKMKVNGKIKTETTLENLIRGLVYDGLSKRDLKTVAFLLGQAERLGLFNESPTDAGAAEEIDETADQIVRRVIERLSARRDGQ
jgi:hypothetical protein